ncbi:MAG: DUF4398 domain-containing protein [Bradymonadaceae bacterium]|nr:DUF4398 domain-containing protein [Lujinxingiaceae bacterium]
MTNPTRVSYSRRAFRASGLLRAVYLLLALVVLSLSLGCGPIQSTQRISEAEVAMERARVADAEIRAPYEFYSAYHYLYKAKEEWGYSDFEASYDYATQARRAAEAALLKAKEDPWEKHPVDDTYPRKDPQARRTR